MIKDSLDRANIEKIKRAIEIEEKYQFINVCGKTSTFSQFLVKEMKKIYKLSGKSLVWENLIDAFSYYPYENVLQRKRLLKRFILQLNKELHPEGEKKKNNTQTTDIYSTDVTFVKGVGPKVGQILNKLGIFTVFDLISYFPRKYVDYSKRIFIKDFVEGENVTVFGKISQVSSFQTKSNLTVVKVQIKDETKSFWLNFFYAKANKFLSQRYRSQFPVNSSIIISGTVKRDNYTGQFTIDKPQYQIIDSDEVFENDNLNLARIVPIYTLSENLNIKTLRKAINNALNDYSAQIKNLIPDEIIKQYDLMERFEALNKIHFPPSQEELDRARYTLVFEELFLLQMKLGLMRQDYSNNRTMKISISDDGLVKRFINSLPFTLTDAQYSAINEILNDINSDKPMQRLLQGDVGSGKTVVATCMLLAAVENGYQAAIMAPTEILAQQHFNNLINWLMPLGVNIALFTSSNSKRLRNKIETDLRNGQVNIAVGTQALLQDNINFNRLGAIVIDEQHRFGVKQRNALKVKAEVPQTLTMTATPIPRTLALTVHGDLDLTVIDELPKGRKPIKTALLTESKVRQAYNLIRQQAELGHQSYIVFPLIDESETLSAKAATKMYEELKEGEFSDLKLGLLHGKMKPEEKDEVMKKFKQGDFDILVSTTVVEVGVDVPNATVMMIENAERFGLSQLHQLRGRVGRGDAQSYCVLISGTKNEETLYRLNVMTQTNDGFVIAEKDLEIRGPGEFLGVRQSGIAELHLTDLTKDIKILELARKSAFDYLKTHKNEDMSEDLRKYLNIRLISSKDIISLD